MIDTDEKQFINIRLGGNLDKIPSKFWLFFVNFRLVIIEMRNHFATLYDMLIKNMDKLKKPRSSHADHMMY